MSRPDSGRILAAAAFLGLGLFSLAPSRAHAQAQSAPLPPSLPPPELVAPRTTSGTDLPRQLAATMADQLRACQAKPEGQKLACYDLMTSKLSPSLGMAASTGAWQVDSGDGKNMTASVGSVSFSATQDSFIGTGASFYVRCRDGQTQAYVAYGTKIAEKGAAVAAASVHIDGATGELGMSQWVPSKAGTAIGLWTTQASRGLVKTLLEAHNVKVGLVLDDHDFLVADFDVAGAAVALAPLQDTCGPW